VLEKPLDKGRSKEQNVGIKKSKPDCKKVKIQVYPPEENDALVIGCSRGRGGNPGPYVGESGTLWELCNKFK